MGKRISKSTVRDVAKVSVSKPVDGSVVNKKASVGRRRGSRGSNVTVEKIPADLLAEMKAALRPGEKLLILSPTQARTVYSKDK